jgi:hypothetical protein
MAPRWPHAGLHVQGSPKTPWACSYLSFGNTSMHTGCMNTAVLLGSATAERLCVASGPTMPLQSAQAQLTLEDALHDDQ